MNQSKNVMQMQSVFLVLPRWPFQCIMKRKQSKMKIKPIAAAALAAHHLVAVEGARV